MTSLLFFKETKLTSPGTSTPLMHFGGGNDVLTGGARLATYVK
jgi:hypothetical protein